MSGLLLLLLWAGEGGGAQPLLVERAQEIGLEFEYWNGMTGRRLMPEIVGGGAALFDYDRDGDLDLFLVQGMSLEDSPSKVEPVAPHHRLFQNQWIDASGDESGRLVFVDVSVAAGLAALDPSYGIGVTTADYDDDGDVDLYVTNLGRNQLLENGGDGTFTEVGERSGVADAAWGVPALFFDYDGDGALDLYVGNYVEYSVPIDKECRSLAGIKDYCGPLAYEPARDRLFRNLGDGSFRDLTASAGIDLPGSTLGAEAADLNGDGRIDLYIANDGMPNFLWLNQGDGTFVEDGLISGMAVNQSGQPEASMGTALGDYDSDGDEDLFLTHLAGETNTLYQNQGDGFFEDVTRGSGLGTASWSGTGFGAAWLDYDLDGRLDLIYGNGAVRFPEDADAAEMFPLEQADRLFHNLGDGRFEEVTPTAAPDLLEEYVTRGIALGDLDNDGDQDVVVVNNSGPLRVFVNQRDRSGDDPAWVGVVLSSERAAASHLAPVELIHGSRTLIRRSKVTGSYASASDPRLVFGLSGADELESKTDSAHVVVRWNGARPERFPVELGRYNTLVLGNGEAVRSSADEPRKSGGTG